MRLVIRRARPSNVGAHPVAMVGGIRAAHEVCKIGLVLLPMELNVIAAAEEQAMVLAGDPNHTVAAAAMDTTGRIYTAVNDYHFTGGPCAELVVLGVAAAAGAGPLTTMAAVGKKSRGVLAPCGRCRQVILDQHPDCFVAVPGNGAVDLVSVRHLLPHAFRHPDTRPERFIRFSPRYYDSIQSGSKTATTRFDDPCQLGPVWLIFEFDHGYRRLPGFVEAIDSKGFSELSDADAKLESVNFADELRAGLRGHYPTINDADEIDVVKFRVESS